jgi:hypothetical protein
MMRKNETHIFLSMTMCSAVFNRLDVTSFKENGVEFHVDVQIDGWRWVSHRTNSNRTAMPELMYFESLTKTELEQAVLAMIKREEAASAAAYSKSKSESESGGD